MPNWNGPQPGLLSLRSLLRQSLGPLSDKSNIEMGIYNDRTIAGTSRKSLHAEGRALDVPANANTVVGKALGDGLFHLAIKHAKELGIQELIWNGKIYTPGQGVHPYYGSNPHTDHVHIGLTRESSQHVAFPNFADDLKQLNLGVDNSPAKSNHLAHAVPKNFYDSLRQSFQTEQNNKLEQRQAAGQQTPDIGLS